MKKLFSVVLVIMITAVSVLSGCGNSGGDDQTAGDGAVSEGATYKLRLSSEYSTENHQTVALLDAAKIINEKSDGRIEINVYPSNQLGDYTVVYGQVMTGDIDIAALPLATTYDMRAAVVNMPFLATNYEEFKRDYFPGSFIWDLLSEINEELGCTLLGVFNAGFMGIGAAKLPDMGFADLTDGSIQKNPLLRVPPSNVFAAIIAEMGYRTTSIPYADLYPALQSGVADGWIGGSGLVNWDSFRDVINYFIDCRAVNECILIVMNEDTLNGMSNEDRRLIQNTFLETCHRVADERQQQEEQALDDLDGIGVKIISGTEAEMTALRDRMRSRIWSSMEDDLGKELIDKLCEIYNVTL